MNIFTKKIYIIGETSEEIQKNIVKYINPILMEFMVTGLEESLNKDTFDIKLTKKIDENKIYLFRYIKLKFVEKGFIWDSSYYGFFVDYHEISKK
jgi:hypothetical protein